MAYDLEPDDSDDTDTAFAKRLIRASERTSIERSPLWVDHDTDEAEMWRTSEAIHQPIRRRPA